MDKNPASGAAPQVLGAAPPSGSRFDIIVIGGGAIGLSAAYCAAARGFRTLLLEQFDTLANSRAGSGGASRMFRVTHASAGMTKLAESALALWKDIEAASGSEILWTQPTLFYGETRNTVQGNLAVMQRILADLGLPYSWYPDAASITRSYGAFHSMPPGYSGLAQASSAVIRAPRSITAFADLATRAGATLLTNQPAIVTGTHAPYQVSCPAGPYSADALILCPGGWTNSLLQPFGFQLDLTIWEMTVAYFQADVANHDYPVWYEFGPNDQSLFYGFPPDEMPGHLKAGADFTYAIHADPSQCTYQPDTKILAQLGGFLHQRFKGVRPTPSNATTCLYTMSADAQMILDRLPDHNVAIFAGDSGRGFKFTPLFGRLLVDLATTGQTNHNISSFAMSRRGIIKS